MRFEMPDLTAYINVKSPAGCGGSYCGSFVVGNGAVRDLASRFEQVLSGCDFLNRAPKTFDYDAFDVDPHRPASVLFAPGSGADG